MTRGGGRATMSKNILEVCLDLTSTSQATSHSQLRRICVQRDQRSISSLSLPICYFAFFSKKIVYLRIRQRLWYVYIAEKQDILSCTLYNIINDNVTPNLWRLTRSWIWWGVKRGFAVELTFRNNYDSQCGWWVHHYEHKMTIINIILEKIRDKSTCSWIQ